MFFRELFGFSANAFRKRTKGHKSRKGRFQRPLAWEEFEERVVLTTTLFLDFGDAFGAGGLTVTDADMAMATINGPSVFGAGHNLISLSTTIQNEAFDFDGNGTVDGNDANALELEVLASVQQSFAPFDVIVQLAYASNITDVANSLAANGNGLGNRDIYVFVAGDDPPPPNDAYGWSQIDTGNLEDNTSFAFADEILRTRPGNIVFALASVAAHEAGHALGLEHTKGDELIVTGDVMDGESPTADDYNTQNIFTRFDLPLEGGGTQNAFDILADSNVVGLAPTGPATITGTGAHDKITIVRSSATTAQVTVQAFSTTAMDPGDLIGTETYAVDTTEGLIVEAGAGDDQIIVDADILKNIEVRGGLGSDLVQIDGTGTFMPTGHFDHVTYFATGAGTGRVDFDGLFSVSFSELEPLTLNLAAGVLTISVNDGLGHNIGLEDDGNLANNMSHVTIDGGLEDVAFLNPNALYLQANAGNDIITLKRLDPGLTGTVVIEGGQGNDQLIVDSTNGLVSGLSSLFFDGGLGFDRVDMVQTGGTQTNESVFIGALPGSGRHVLTGLVETQTLDFQNIEPFTSNVVVDTFNISSTPAIASLLAGNNAINYSAGLIMGPTWGRVTVDNFEPIEFQNKTNLQISAGGGNDHVVLDNADTPDGLKSITVNGEAGNDIIEAFNVGIVADAAFIHPLKFTGGSGADRLDASALEQVINVELQGDTGKDELLGGAGEDLYNGGTGDDLLVDSLGADEFNGGAGTDTILIQGTEDDDTILLDQTSTTGLTVTFNLDTSANTFSAVELVRVEAGDGDDLIGINVNDALITTGPPDVDNGSLAFRVNGGSPNASDRLIVRDDGTGDLVIHRQGPDGRSGSITVGPLKPVTYDGIEFVDITPINTATGQTGTNFDGRLVVFPYDRYESNATRLAATQLGGQPIFLSNLTIDPGPVTLPAPFGDIGGDEDWFAFKADRTSVYRFDVLFQMVPTLLSGRQGLPSDGDLDIQIYDASGALVGSSTTTTDNESLDVGIIAGNQYFLRVYGFNTAINVYQLNVTNLDQLGPQIFDPDGVGPLNGVHITDNPATAINEANYNLFDPKPAIDGPTPFVSSLTIHVTDHINALVGDLFGALDPTTASQPGLYRLVGDRNGAIPISAVIITNDALVAGQAATATIELQFATPLPDDRYTLTILDSLTDQGGNKLDGESNAAEPQSPPLFPSGNNISGGKFVARFTVDSRPEIAVYAGTTVTTDINGNFKFDPQNVDYTNRDLVFQFGTVSDQRFAGKLGQASAFGTYFDVLAAYGKVNGQFRFLIDKNGNGAFDAGESFVSPLQVDGLAVAGNFDGNAANGDEIAIFSGTKWYLDVFGAQTVVTSSLRGYPIVGDFDGDGAVDLATYQNNTFYFDLANNGFGQQDAVIHFGAPGVLDRAIAADMDGDGITDIGIWVPKTGTVTGEGEWQFLISNDFASVVRVTGTVVTLDHPFSPAPLGSDLAAQFGDSRALPLLGNFDPPITPAATVVSTTSPPVSTSQSVVATQSIVSPNKVTQSTTSNIKVETPVVTTPLKTTSTVAVDETKTTTPSSTVTTPINLSTGSTTTQLTQSTPVSSTLKTANTATTTSSSAIPAPTNAKTVTSPTNTKTVTNSTQVLSVTPTTVVTSNKPSVVSSPQVIVTNVTTSVTQAKASTSKPSTVVTPTTVVASPVQNVSVISVPVTTSKKTKTSSVVVPTSTTEQSIESPPLQTATTEVRVAAKKAVPKIIQPAAVKQSVGSYLGLFANKLKTTKAENCSKEADKTDSTTSTLKTDYFSSKLSSIQELSSTARTGSTNHEASIDQFLASTSKLRLEKKGDFKLPAEWARQLVWITEHSSKHDDLSTALQSSKDQEYCEAKTENESSADKSLTHLLPQFVDSVFSSQSDW